MEEIIEELRALNQAGIAPLSLPDEDELVEIEEALLISLPRDYREFLLEVSDVVYGPIEPATVTDPHLHTYLPELAAQAWDQGLPREFIPICEYSGGYAAIDQNGTVHWWQAGKLKEAQWETIWHWARDVWLGGESP